MSPPIPPDLDLDLDPDPDPDPDAHHHPSTFSSSSSSSAEGCCPLCHHPISTLFSQDAFRPYRRCILCGLVYVPSQFHLSPQEEKNEYDKHENDPADERYRAFLARLVIPLHRKLQQQFQIVREETDLRDRDNNRKNLKEISNFENLGKGEIKTSNFEASFLQGRSGTPGAPTAQYITKFKNTQNTTMHEAMPPGLKGLDFGCGPAPTLSLMFTDLAGYHMSVYDHFYFPDHSCLHLQQHQTPYDFITATEVIEHVARPDQVLDTLLACLNPRGGVLALMTKLVVSAEKFHNWHYKRDQTHVCFYSKQTFQWISQTYGLHLEFVGTDVIFLSYQHI